MSDSNTGGGKYHAVIAGTGSFVPERLLTNEDLAKMVDTSDEWITTRTGIKVRHIASDKETTVTLAVQAAKRALAQAKLEPQELDIIIVATITPEMVFPSTACFVQRELGAEMRSRSIWAPRAAVSCILLQSSRNLSKVGVLKTLLSSAPRP